MLHSSNTSGAWRQNRRESEEAATEWGAHVPEAATNDADSRVLIIDALRLRRDGIRGLLRDWAVTHAVELDTADPPDADTAETAHGYRLCILSLGSLPVSAPDATAWMTRLKERHPATPLVVWSDRNEPQEVLHALQNGARGFLPTTMSPEVAMRALSFIMSGGTFFPPEALTDPSLTDAGTLASDGHGHSGHGEPDGGGPTSATSRRAVTKLPQRRQATPGDVAFTPADAPQRRRAGIPIGSRSFR